MTLLLKASSSARGFVASHTTSCIQSLNKGNAIYKAFGATSSAAFSSSSSKDGQPPQFRPRRRTPKNFQEVPKTKFRSRKATSPITLSNKNPNASLESKYGNATAAAIRDVRRNKERDGSVHTTDAEATMRIADYLTAEIGSTEDLVGERRALMDAWDSNQAELFQTELEKLIDEGSEFSFKDLPWKEGESKENNAQFGSTSSSVDGDAEDPNQKAFGPWSDTIVRVDRVQKVLRGGTMVRYRALVIGGNLNGCAGFGVAKANAPNEAAAAASRIAKRNLFFVDRYLNTGLTTDLAGRHNSCKVTLRSVNPNRGLHGHPLILEILKYFGITDCTAKSHGNRNVYNVVYATFKAIMTHESLEDIALKRGKRLLNLERARRLNV